MQHTVVIIDHVQANAQALQVMLSSTYNIVVAQSGKEALEIMGANIFPSAVMVNFMLPDITAFDVLRYMKDNILLKSTPVIFLLDDCINKNERPSVIDKALTAGAADCICVTSNCECAPINCACAPFLPGTVNKKLAAQIELKTFREDMKSLASAQARQLEVHTEELNASHSAIIMGMSMLSESRDQVTGAHVKRIKLLTKILSEKYAQQYPDVLSFKDASVITTYSPLHDVGKVGVPDAVLKKSGGLTMEEFDQMKSHTIGGGTLLRQVASLLSHDHERINIAIEIAECHHERYDGTGYPKGLKGEDIPLSARIVAIADIYDALRSKRQYKPGFTHEETMEILLVGDGRTSPAHFDPQVLEIVEEIHEQLRDAYDSNPDPQLELSAG